VLAQLYEAKDLQVAKSEIASSFILRDLQREAADVQRSPVFSELK